MHLLTYIYIIFFINKHTIANKLMAQYYISEYCIINENTLVNLNMTKENGNQINQHTFSWNIQTNYNNQLRNFTCYHDYQHNITYVIYLPIYKSTFISKYFNCNIYSYEEMPYEEV